MTDGEFIEHIARLAEGKRRLWISAHDLRRIMLIAADNRSHRRIRSPKQLNSEDIQSLITSAQLAIADSTRH